MQRDWRAPQRAGRGAEQHEGAISAQHVRPTGGSPETTLGPWGHPVFHSLLEELQHLRLRDIERGYFLATKEVHTRCTRALAVRRLTRY